MLSRINWTLFCLKIRTFKTPLWLAPCRGRGGLVCFDDLTSYVGWNFHVPGRAT